jgi:NAD dependent epimerase/dehydratase family enzyme
MLTPFRLGLGGRVGSGRQWWSWVSLTDAVAAYRHALASDLEGPVNVTAPGVVTSAEFTRALGRALNRPTIFPLPAFAVKLMFGEMGVELLLRGRRAVPAKLEASGFAFSTPGIDEGLEAALGA